MSLRHSFLFLVPCGKQDFSLITIISFIKSEGIVKALETVIISQIEKNQEQYNELLQQISDQFGKHAEVINNQGKQIGTLHQLQKKDNNKLLKLISLYAELLC